MWAVRVHTDAMGSDWLPILLKLLRHDIAGYVFALETQASREHIQGWVGTDISREAFVARLKRAFPLARGNRMYSVKVVKHEQEYKDYVLKGTVTDMPTLVCHMSFDASPEAIKIAHERYWAKHQTMRNSKMGIVQEVCEWAQSQERVSRWDIAYQVCDLTTSRNKPLMLHYVRGVVNAVEWKVNSQERDKFMDDIINKL